MISTAVAALLGVPVGWLLVALRDALDRARRDFTEARLRVAAWGLAGAETAVTRCRRCGEPMVGQQRDRVLVQFEPPVALASRLRRLPHDQPRVSKRRQVFNLHRRELADLAGTSEPTIVRIENGSMNPSDAMRLAIAGVLRCEVDSLWSYPSCERIHSNAERVA